MSRKQLTLLLAVVVVLGVAWLVVHQRNAGSWSAGGQEAGGKLLGNLPTNDIAGLLIKSGTNVMTLHLTNDIGCVADRGDYPADFSLIKGFVLKAAGLKATQTEPADPSQLGRYKLLPPGPATNSGTLVEFKNANGKTLNSLLIGKEHLRKSNRPSPMGEFGDQGYPDGRYVMVGTDPKTVDIISDPLSSAEVKPESWLNKDFFKVEKIRSIDVAFAVATNSWKVSRETESSQDWKLADATPEEKLDSAKTSSFGYALSAPTFSDVRSPDTKAPTGLDKPTVITLNTFDNFTYTLKVGAKTNDDYYLTLNVAADLPKERTPGKDEKAEDKAKLDKDFKDAQAKLQDKLAREQGYGKWIYLVSAWTVDPLLKERWQLMQEKKPETGNAETNSVPSLDATNSLPTLEGTNAVPKLDGTNSVPKLEATQKADAKPADQTASPDKAGK